MRKKSKIMRISTLVIVMIFVLTFAFTSCKEVIPPDDTPVDEGPVIPTATDVAESINGYVDELITKVSKADFTPSVDVSSLLNTLSGVSVMIDNLPSDSQLNKIVFANNTLCLEGVDSYNGQTSRTTQIIRFTENGVTQLYGDGSKYEGEYETWFESFGLGNDDKFTLSQIDFNALKEALKLEEDDFKVVEEGIYQVKSSAIISAIKDVTNVLGFEDTDNSVSFNTLLNMSLTIDVREYVDGIMVVDLNIPDVIKANFNILNKDEFKIDYELYVFDGESASESESSLSCRGNIFVKNDSFNVSADATIPSESISCKIECSGRNIDAQLSADCKIDVQYGNGELVEKLAIEAHMSVEVDADGDISLIAANASVAANANNVLTAKLDYNVTDDNAAGECSIEVYPNGNTTDKMVIAGTLSAKLDETKCPSLVDLNVTASLNEQNLLSVEADCSLTVDDNGITVIVVDANATTENVVLNFDTNVQVNATHLVKAEVAINAEVANENESIQPRPSEPAANSDTIALTISINQLSSNETSTKYHCEFTAANPTIDTQQNTSFDITFGGVTSNLTNQEKLLLEYYDTILLNYHRTTARAQDYSNAIRQMAEQNLIPSDMPRSFCLADPNDSKIGYFMDITQNLDGTYEVDCFIDIADEYNIYLETYPIIEKFFVS